MTSTNKRDSQREKNDARRDAGGEVDAAIADLHYALNLAYANGLHEFGYDPIAVLNRALAESRAEVSGLRASRIAYASEFPLNADGDPDVGNIHANIRALKARAERAESHSRALAGALREIEDVGRDEDGDHWYAGEHHATCVALARAALEQEPQE